MTIVLLQHCGQLLLDRLFICSEKVYSQIKFYVNKLLAMTMKYMKYVT